MLTATVNHDEGAGHRRVDGVLAEGRESAGEASCVQRRSDGKQLGAPGVQDVCRHAGCEDGSSSVGSSVKSFGQEKPGVFFAPGVRTVRTHNKASVTSTNGGFFVPSGEGIRERLRIANLMWWFLNGVEEKQGD